MAFPPTEPDETHSIEVTVHEDGTVIESARFDTLEEATMFAENWTDQRPTVHVTIEDPSHDHTAWETIQATGDGDPE